MVLGTKKQGSPKGFTERPHPRENRENKITASKRDAEAQKLECDIITQCRTRFQIRFLGLRITINFHFVLHS